MYLVKVPHALYRQWIDEPGSTVRLGDVRECDGELIIAQPNGAEYRLCQNGSSAHLQTFTPLAVDRTEDFRAVDTMTYMRTRCTVEPGRTGVPKKCPPPEPEVPRPSSGLDTHKKRCARKSTLSEDQQDDVIEAIAEYLRKRPGKGCTFTFEDLHGVDGLIQLQDDDLFEPLLTIATYINNTWRLRPDVRDIYGL